MREICFGSFGDSDAAKAAVEFLKRLGYCARYTVSKGRSGIFSTYYVLVRHHKNATFANTGDKVFALPTMDYEDSGYEQEVA